MSIEFIEELFGFVFHWISELFLAVLGIALSIMLLSRGGRERTAVYFVLGMTACSTFNAVYHYTYKEPVLPLASFTGLFFIVSIVLLVLGLRLFGDRTPGVRFGLFSLGLSVYLLLNLLGIQGQQGEWSFFALLLFVTGCALYFAFRLAGSGRSQGIRGPAPGTDR